VFTAPEGAARAVALLGVQKGTEYLFDDLRLSPLPAEAKATVAGGVGQVEAVVPGRVEAGGFGTFRLTYRAGKEGLPVGGALEVRRSNLDPRWSMPQVSDPAEPGYTTVVASTGAQCLV